jgi:hypothetical protein
MLQGGGLLEALSGPSQQIGYCLLESLLYSLRNLVLYLSGLISNEKKCGACDE